MISTHKYLLNMSPQKIRATMELINQAANELDRHVQAGKLKLVMSSFRCIVISGKYDYQEDVQQTQTKHPCGTAGCFLGNCPFLGIKALELKPSDLTNPWGGGGASSKPSVGWLTYGESRFALDSETALWKFLFSGAWSDCTKQLVERVQFATSTVERYLKKQITHDQLVIDLDQYAEQQEVYLEIDIG